MSVITIERKVLEKNDEIAGQIRALLAERNVFSINLISAPGAGKTTILEKTLERINGAVNVAVVEGDVQTDLDAQRVARYGVPAVQIVTRGGCHLDAILLRDALSHLNLSGIDLLIIENVGNLVCPANYDLGETHKVVVLSTTEGDDKPLKYPQIFHNASVLIINKIDLLPYLPVRIETIRTNALSVNPRLTIFETSCTTGQGIDAWCVWLETNTMKRRTYNAEHHLSDSRDRADSLRDHPDPGG